MTHRLRVRSLVISLLIAAGANGAAAQRARPAPPAPPPPRSVIVDTDAGPDDLMAIAFLLSSPRVHVEAICVGVGLAHIAAGASNILNLLELAGRRDVAVYMGRTTPLAGDREFPADWRRLSDSLAGVTLPKARRAPESKPAAQFLAERLADTKRPVDVLALGGLTNLAEAFAANPAAAPAIQHLVIMGGAVRVPGNLADGGVTANTTAEWNFYVDPEAARRVFASGAPIRLIDLDATRRVPIDAALVGAVSKITNAPLARAVSQVLATAKEWIDRGTYFAWDPLAAVALVDSSVVRLEPASIAIRQRPPEDGRTALEPRGKVNARIAVDADAKRFRQLFIGALAGNAERR